MKKRRTATVMRNSYITLFKHHYSAPKEYIGKRVDIVHDSETQEIFHGLRHVATHYRDDTPYGYTQKASHNLLGRHGSYEKDLGEIFQRAISIDNIVLVYFPSRVWMQPGLPARPRKPRQHGGWSRCRARTRSFWKRRSTALLPRCGMPRKSTSACWQSWWSRGAGRCN